MNYEQSINYIHSIPKFRRPLGNANLEKLLTHLDNPQKKLKFIHIAGTNGKGSTAAMTAEILKKSGFKTGLFTSPYLEVFNERIRINGENITDNDLAEYVTRVKAIMEKNNALVSEFAFITAVSFLYFYEKQCDIVVLEVGMGGKLDATNVIDSSLVSVICKIGLDHTQYLGNTIEEIAKEKCGIMRDGGTAVSYPNNDVRDIIEKYAKSKNVSLTFADTLLNREDNVLLCLVIFADTALPTENGFIYKCKEYPLSLKGTYQPQNAAVVLEIASALNKQGFNISDEDISYGLSHTSWAARFEFVSDRVVIDGGHNIDGIKALKKSLLSLNRDIVLVIAMMEDKDYKACIREISPVAKAVFATQLDMPRCLSSEKISDIIGSMNIPVFVNNNPKDALQNALDFSDNSIVCVCGSLYLAGEIKKIFHKK